MKKNQDVHSSESQAVKQVAEDYACRVWQNRDLTAVKEVFHEKCVIHSLLGNFYGPESMKNVIQEWWKGFPDLVVSNTAIIAEKDLAVIHWQAQGSHQGEFKGIKPTGKTISYAGVTIYRISLSTIVEYWAYLDMQHLLKQIS